MKLCFGMSAGYSRIITAVDTNMSFEEVCERIWASEIVTNADVSFRVENLLWIERKDP